MLKHHAETDATNYHFYIGKTSRENLLSRRMATHYRYRLEVELSVRDLKSRSKHVGVILVYPALLTLLVSRMLLDLMSEHAANETVSSPERWAAILIALSAHPRCT